jgi:16S rRNA (cytosine967-C5)-methyltransferase
LAVSLLASVLNNGRALDDALSVALGRTDIARLEPRDRGLARLIASTVLRRKGELEAVLDTFLAKPIAGMRGAIVPILLSGAAQLLVLKTPAHAAIGLAVEQCHLHPSAQRFAGLTNAVLRRVAAEGDAVLGKLSGATLNIPAWLYVRWLAAYGDEVARRIAEASLQEAPLDISVKSDAASWAERFGGRVLPTGSVRLAAGGRIEDLAGYDEGAWWVQDAAAALPASLFGDVRGLEAADLCAAPGGKTAMLAAAGARVTAVDVSSERLQRVAANLQRLRLDADIVAADATNWQPGRTFDAVLVDAPCTATGTLRRHPDILHLKRETDLAPLAALQTRLLAHAASLVRPGGTLVYCTCSLEPEEGPVQITRFLDAHRAFVRMPIEAGAGVPPDWITPHGELRTLPFHMPSEDRALSGMDAFFAARLQRTA